MKGNLHKKILAEYPEWHENPFRLNIAEMEKPLKVIKYFFECYDLPVIRTCLREWLEDALTGTVEQAKDHLYTYNDVEKLVEAVFVIYRKGKWHNRRSLRTEKNKK